MERIDRVQAVREASNILGFAASLGAKAEFTAQDIRLDAPLESDEC